MARYGQTQSILKMVIQQGGYFSKAWYDIPSLRDEYERCIYLGIGSFILRYTQESLRDDEDMIDMIERYLSKNRMASEISALVAYAISYAETWNEIKGKLEAIEDGMEPGDLDGLKDAVMDFSHRLCLEDDDD